MRRYTATATRPTYCAEVWPSALLMFLIVGAMPPQFLDRRLLGRDCLRRCSVFTWRHVGASPPNLTHRLLFRRALLSEPPCPVVFSHRQTNMYPGVPNLAYWKRSIDQAQIGSFLDGWTNSAKHSLLHEVGSCCPQVCSQKGFRSPNFCWFVA